MSSNVTWYGRTTFMAVVFALVWHLPCIPPAFSQEDYVLGPNDEIVVTISAGGEVRNTTTVMVSDKGLINCPYLGEVKAQGVTVHQLRGTIKEQLAKDYFVDPHVEIAVRSYSSRKVYLLGRVVKPGVYPLYQNTTLLDILSGAGGLANPGAGRYAYVIRKSVGDIREGGKIEEIMMDKEPLKIDLERLLDEGDVSHDRRLENGDVIYIPAQESADLWEENVCVMGEVNSPGVYPMKRGLTAMTACLMAGGFTDFAAPNRAKLMRVEKGQQKTIKINLKKVMEGKEKDVPLKAGDRIYVPESWL